MNNPFELIEARLSRIEDLIYDLKHQLIKVEPIDQPKEFLTIQEAAEFLNITVPRMYRRQASNGFSVMNEERRLYFSRTEVIKYLTDGRRKTWFEFISNNKDNGKFNI
jgi:hypothetical protein